MTQTTKAVIYYRVSTEEQARNGVSLDQQKKSCQNYADQNSITVDQIFHDDGVSAKTTKRKGLQDLLAYCTKNHKNIDYVIVYKIDRLSRNSNDYTTMYAMLTKLDIQLVSTVEQIDKTPMGKFMGTFMAANAQLDNDMKSERVSSCMMEKFNQGKWYGSAPLGYLNTKDALKKNIIIVDEEKSHHVRYIFTEYAKGISTLEEIRGIVNERGLTTSKGNSLSSQMISKIIGNTFYYGLMYSQKHEKYNMGTHDPLISEETFYACQDRLGTKKGPQAKVIKKEVSEVFPLRNEVKCAFCLRPLTGGPSKGKMGKIYYYYRCYNKNCDNLKSINKDDIHESFLGFVKSFTPSERSLCTLRKALMNSWEHRYKELNADRIEAEKQLLVLDKEKSELITLARKQIFADEEIKEMMDDLRKRTRKVQCKASASHDSTFDMDTAITLIFPLLKDLPSLWNQASCEDKKKIQSLIFVEMPSYDGNGFTTPQLSLILAESKALKGADPNRVARRGIEPLLPG